MSTRSVYYSSLIVYSVELLISTACIAIVNLAIDILCEKMYILQDDESK